MKKTVLIIRACQIDGNACYQSDDIEIEVQRHANARIVLQRVDRALDQCRKRYAERQSKGADFAEEEGRDDAEREYEALMNYAGAHPDKHEQIRKWLEESSHA